MAQQSKLSLGTRNALVPLASILVAISIVIGIFWIPISNSWTPYLGVFYPWCCYSANIYQGKQSLVLLKRFGKPTIVTQNDIQKEIEFWYYKPQQLKFRVKKATGIIEQGSYTNHTHF